MSMHPSLSATEKGKKARAVLKRVERLKWLKEREQWQEGDKVYGLPKIKAVRIKIKKEKAEKAAEGAATEATAATTPAAGAKAAPAKEAKK